MPALRIHAGGFQEVRPAFRCPECYVTFAEGLRGLLKTMHKGTRHTGKAPESLRAIRENADRMMLQAKLAKAIKDENYEQAAQVRDEIKQLTGRHSRQLCRNK